MSPKPALQPKTRAKNQKTAAVSPATVSPEPATIVPTPATIGPTQEEIAALAYRYWEARQGNPGSAEEDWLHAERDLQQKHAGAPDPSDR